jgi:hypothetical protein
MGEYLIRTNGERSIRITELEAENLHLKEEILEMIGNHKIETQLQAKWISDARAYALKLEKLIVTIKLYGMRNLTLSDLEEIEDIYDRHTPK